DSDRALVRFLQFMVFNLTAEASFSPLSPLATGLNPRNFGQHFAVQPPVPPFSLTGMNRQIMVSVAQLLSQRALLPAEQSAVRCSRFARHLLEVALRHFEKASLPEYADIR